ncbi:MAG: hypothetical protein IAE97_13660 [Chthoniobacterales bacterium]|nr:hypothetical protein [Chthoniobacterales bacterium]
MNLKVNGNKVDPAKYNRLVDLVNSALLRSGVGYQIHRNTGGTVLELNKRIAERIYKPLEMVLVRNEEGNEMIRVYPSTLAGGSSVDLGFADGDDPAYLLSPATGVLQGGITIDETGQVTSRWLEIVDSLTTNTEDTFYVQIGIVGLDDETGQWTLFNTRYGPIDCAICRNWFSNPAQYTVNWSFATIEY